MSAIRKREAHEARVTRICEELAEQLELGWLAITVSFVTQNEDSARNFCEAISDWEYRQTTLRWNLYQVCSADDNAIRECALHELVHALLSPIWDSLPDKTQTEYFKLNELATENVTRAMLALMRMGLS